MTTNAHERQARIVAAALDLATRDCDSVHIRMVADRAGVATSTVYQHFSSKDALLFACFLEWLGARAHTECATAYPVADPYQRLVDLIQNLTIALWKTPRLAAYAARAYLFAEDTGTGLDTDCIRRSLSLMLVNEICDGTPTENQRVVGDVVADVWSANLLALVQNRISLQQMLIRLQLAVSAIGERARYQEAHQYSGVDGSARVVGRESIQGR
ncbi:TetR family transcriptional regulator [Mycolicibacterium sp. P9-64]|uniref:TetR family transcriptional regulator n=1 Tax=Mycolicibacterium sp. P9-64 TaxID=2024612 RepID=UPI001566BAC1|nr:TetR family transcriptional regulator [Mycolicibacterium sp. P9-64]